MKKPSGLLLILCFFIIASCAMERNIEKNLSKLDELYGPCDNPQRSFTKREYKICKDKERANVGDPLNAETITEKVLKALPSNVGGGQGGVQSSTNNQLWQASLKTINQYPIKIADFNGGFIETEWIVDEIKQQRCIVKIQIKSRELVSNGVDANFVCQNKIDDQWVNDKNNYTEESKQLILAILKNSNTIN